ncbi:MAG: hypothetical protein H7837_07965 [Magnetococcus sp. MYC-9]
MILTATGSSQSMNHCAPYPPRRPQAGVGWRCLLAAICFVLGVPVVGLSGEGDTARGSVTALERFTQAAMQGDAVAQTNLGAMYLHGVGVRRDLTKAYNWFQRAAEQGEGLAQFNLGVLCQEGQGTLHDDQKAAYWFRRLASQTNRVDQFNPVIKGWAQLKLGFAYYEGRGVAKDHREALAWFRLAAERGIAMAQEMLGQMYAQGQGGARDDKRAFFWYEQATRRGNRNAEKPLQELSQKLTLQQQVEARTLETEPLASGNEQQPPTGIPAQLAASIDQKGVSLTVLPNPADAQVRILNIRPPYTPGMRLQPGRYHLEVTRAGYRPGREWVTVQDGDVKLSVALTPESSPVTVREQTPTAPALSPSAGAAAGKGEVVKQTVGAGRGAPLSAVSSSPTRQTVTEPAGKTAAALGKEVTAESAPTVAASPPVVSAPTSVAVSPPVVSAPTSVAVSPPVVLAPTAVRAPLVAVPAPVGERSGEGGRRETPSTTEPRRPTVHKGAATQPTGVEPGRQTVTIQADPVDARIKIMDIVPPYQPGMPLKPGTYRVEVSRPGYETRQLQVKVGREEIRLPVVLAKKQASAKPAVAARAEESMEACPVARQPAMNKPRQYALTVQSDPGDARIQILHHKTPYRPGIALAPGRYPLRIAREAFKTRQCMAEIVDRDLDLAVALQPVAAGDLRALTIKPQPADAQVRFLNAPVPYRAGMLLESGSYRVEVSKKGYKTEQRVVELGSADRVVPIHLTELPLEIRPTLTVLPVLQGVEIRIVNADRPYRPGVPLAPGRYLLELSRPGFKTQQRWVELAEQDVKMEVAMEESVAGEQKQ